MRIFPDGQIFVMLPAVQMKSITRMSEEVDSWKRSVSILSVLISQM